MVAMSLSKINELAKEVLDIEAKSILRLKNNIGEEFDKAIDILYNCKGRVIVTGMGKSGLIGKRLQQQCLQPVLQHTFCILQKVHTEIPV